MVASGLSPSVAYSYVVAQWYKDGHITPLSFDVTALGSPPIVIPVPPVPVIDPDKAAREAREQAAAAASVADMVPGKWNEQHILGAILNSGALPAPASAYFYNALARAAGGAVNAAKPIADTQGSKLSSALSNVRGGMSVADAFTNQLKGVAGNLTDPDFSFAELQGAVDMLKSQGA